MTFRVGSTIKIRTFTKIAAVMLIVCAISLRFQIYPITMFAAGICTGSLGYAIFRSKTVNPRDESLGK